MPIKEKNESSNVEKLVGILKKWSVDEIMEFEEKYDEQYKSLKKMYEKIPDKKYFCIIVLLNALVSYQLNGTGEQYWEEFSKYFRKTRIKDPIEDLIEFLTQSQYNKRLKETKIKRIRKLRKIVRMLEESQDKLYENPNDLLNLLSRALKSPRTSKTLVFAVKMFNYACRIKTGIKRPLPYEIDIPLDNRILKISEKLSGTKNPLELWREISEKTSLPPLHIDSLLWVIYRFARDNKAFYETKIAELYEFIKTALKLGY